MEGGWGFDSSLSKLPLNVNGTLCIGWEGRAGASHFDSTSFSVAGGSISPELVHAPFTAKVGGGLSPDNL